MNYQTQTTVIRNSGLKFICMILPNFQIFPKHSRIFVHSDLKCPFIKFSIKNTYFNPIQDGHFWGCSRMNGGGEWRAKKPPLLNLSTYPTMMKLDSYTLPKGDRKKIWTLWHTPWVLLTSAFFHQKSSNSVISRNTDIDCILVHNFWFF